MRLSAGRSRDPRGVRRANDREPIEFVGHSTKRSERRFRKPRPIHLEVARRTTRAFQELIVLNKWPLLLALFVGVATSAEAQNWTVSTTSKVSGRETLLVVVAPNKGYSVTVESDGQAFPAKASEDVIALPDRTGMVDVKIARKLQDGTTRSHEFRVRINKYTETTAVVTFTGPGSAAAAAAAIAGNSANARKLDATKLGPEKLMGSIKNGCATAEMQVEFWFNGELQTTRVARPHQESRKFEVLRGTYKVRVFQRNWWLGQAAEQKKCSTDIRNNMPLWNRCYSRASSGPEAPVGTGSFDLKDTNESFRVEHDLWSISLEQSDNACRVAFVTK